MPVVLPAETYSLKMKKSASLFLGLVSMGLSAQIDLDTVTVTADLIQDQSLLNSNRNVQIISGEELEKAPVNSVAELLDFATGVDARQRGIFGTQTDLSIRGGSFEQVLVLIDGVRLADPQTGHHLMNLPVAKEDIERIEILLGGGSYIFGANAFSGAINIITKKAKHNNTKLGLDYGQFQTFTTSLQQDIVGKRHQTSLSLSHNMSEGFKSNTDFRHTNLGLRSNWSFGANKFQLQAGYTDQGFGAQNFYSDNFPHQYELTKTLFGSINWETEGKLHWNKQVYWRRNWDEFQLFREEGDDFYDYQNGLFIWDIDTAPGWYTGHNYHRSDVLGFKNDVRWKSKFGQSALSLDYRHEQVRSNNLGDSLASVIEIPNSRGAYYLGADRQNVSLAGQHRISIRKWQISAALQANYNTDFNWGWYPALNLGYRPIAAHKFYGSFNRSFRFPSYTDLFYRLGGALGSRDLRPEESYNYELGYRFFRKAWYGNLSVFYRNGQNIIDWTQACASCDLIAGNSTAVNFGGLEFSVRKNLSADAKLAGIQFFELSYSHLQNFSDTQEEVYRSLYVFDFLKNKITLRAGQKIAQNLSMHYFLSYQQREGQYLDAKRKQLIDYPEVWLINLSLHYDWKDFQFSLQAQNLLNQKYFDRGNVELPGLWAQFGIQYRINYKSKTADSVSN